MNKSVSRNQRYAKGVYAISVAALSLSVVISASGISVEFLPAAQANAFSVFMIVLMFGAVSGPIAEYALHRIRVRSQPAATQLDNKELKQAYLGTRLLALAIAALVIYAGFNGLVFAQMLRIAPSWGDTDPAILVGILLLSLLANFSSWMLVRSIINVINPKPLAQLRWLRSHAHVPETASKSASADAHSA